MWLVNFIFNFKFKIKFSLVVFLCGRKGNILDFYFPVFLSACTPENKKIRKKQRKESLMLYLTICFINILLVIPHKLNSFPFRIVKYFFKETSSSNFKRKFKHLWNYSTFYPKHFVYWSMTFIRGSILLFIILNSVSCWLLIYGLVSHSSIFSTFFIFLPPPNK